ncbi:MAG: sugar phosphate isomerase/epimerase [Verrucomicrobia bacterium]|nr:sugar phosphate isomerase/epimerase [Verrucomicrobiota bacterium]
MQLGIFAKTFRRPDPGTTLEAVRAIGLRCVQFNFECAGLASMPEEVPAAILAAIASASHDTGVRLAALSGTFNMAHPDRERRERGLLRLGVVAEAAAKLGIPLVTLCTGTRDREDMWRAHPDNRSGQAWSDLLESMERALAIAGTAGVALAIEPEHTNVVSDASRARALLDAMQAGDQLQIILDPANLLQKDRNQTDILAEAFALLGADLGLAHAKDRRHDGKVCALGRGVVDFDAYFTGLRSAGFHGPVIMHGFGESEAAESTAFARAKLQERPGEAG